MTRENQWKIPRIPLVPKPIDEAGRRILGFKYAGDDIGKRHQLGGTPTWIQEEDIPQCRYCSELMTFYGQLDSIGDEITIGDCGLIHVFFCFDCNYPEARAQSY